MLIDERDRLPRPLTLESEGASLFTAYYTQYPVENFTFWDTVQRDWAKFESQVSVDRSKWIFNCSNTLLCSRGPAPNLGIWSESQR